MIKENKCKLNRPKRAANANKEQVSLLVEYVSKNPELVNMKFTKTNTRKDMWKKWENVAYQLNLMEGGSVKSAQQWKKKYQDIRGDAKKKKSSNKEGRTKTGGGPFKQQVLTADEQKVIDMLPKAAIDGDDAINESAVQFNCNQINNEHFVNINDVAITESIVNINDEVITESIVEFNDDVIIITEDLPNVKDKLTNKNNELELTNNNNEDTFTNKNSEHELPVNNNDYKLTNENNELELSNNNNEDKLTNKNNESEFANNNYEYGLLMNAINPDHTYEKKDQNCDNKENTENGIPNNNGRMQTSMKKKTIGVRRHEQSIENCKNIINISNVELQIREKYVYRKLYLIAKDIRTKTSESRVLSMKENKLMRPWSS